MQRPISKFDKLRMIPKVHLRNIEKTKGKYQNKEVYSGELSVEIGKDSREVIIMN